MSFFVFKLIFAVIALALLVVAGFIVRNHRRGRQAVNPATARPPEPKAARLKMPSLAKKAPDPAPEEPATPRRRQLHSFAEAEKTAAEEAAAPQAEPLAEIESDAAEPAVPQPIDEPADEGYDFTDHYADDYAQAVLGRLEQAFEALQAGEMALPAYRERVRAEQVAVEQRIAALEREIESDELDAALAARESVRWCLDWADAQAGEQANDPAR